ncbi:CRISPR system Cascade subunit CasD [Amycolatopsis arida]|uniref:CRISPR system Cascade subunit CasD n=1 Tax=Amycolatopsis arida TaxID=587909 RepID=A0A1I5R1Y7_9PSEU|nr:type I-E CRISPR-associated protein Cas5/CasD [Amycolatopsis arida]TDX99039.1 CRISPR system Cascade subunit CasD [Amycolatopsis arida]SFP52321.1 CRISPR system Cascade subunit CasD [Amycolatopsis arida]
MSVLVLRLAAPLQSWGTSSRFSRRGTDREPSKSGIVGLLAAAMGRKRTDSIEDLAALRVGVRVDQPGRVERDFQTARPLDGPPLPLSYRFYLADAVFLAAVEGDDGVVEELRDAIRRPVFPLYLGRRSCPPAGPLWVELRSGGVRDALESVPWQASKRVREEHGAPTVDLDVVVDCPPDDPRAILVRDEPVSFDPRHRRYGWRAVIREAVTVETPPVDASPDRHDPMDVLPRGDG